MRPRYLTENWSLKVLARFQSSELPRRRLEESGYMFWVFTELHNSADLFNSFKEKMLGWLSW